MNESAGNPSEFFGNAYVAFVDILGFTRTVSSNWNQSNKGAVARLLRIKSAIPNAQSHVRYATYFERSGDDITYSCRIATVSDSFVISVALPPGRLVKSRDLMLGFFTLAHQVVATWRACISEGFTVRGAIEWGPIYWNPTEIIGPAFNNACAIEKDVARWSRVVFGPLIVRILGRAVAHPGFVNDPLSPLFWLNKDPDGVMSLSPLRLVNSGNKEIVVAQLEAMRAQCVDDHTRSKYDQLVTDLTDPHAVAQPTLHDLRTYFRRFKLSAPVDF